MTTPTMTIDGVEYVEAQEIEPNSCAGCVFVHDRRKCDVAYSEAGDAEFGGDCHVRLVIYLRKA